MATATEKRVIQITVDSRQAMEQFNKLNKNMQRISKSTQTMADRMARLQGLFFTLGGGFALRGFFNLADATTLMEARLKSANVAMDNFTDFQRDLAVASNAAHTDIEAFSTTLTRFQVAMKDTGVNTQQLMDWVSGLGKELIRTGASTSETASVIRQFSQALSKGKLDGDEFRSMAEGMASFMPTLEKVLGETQGEIREMAEAGLLTRDVMIQFLDELAAKSGQLPQTFGAALIQIKNNTVVLMQAFKDAGNGSNVFMTALLKLGDGILWMADNIETVQQVLDAFLVLIAAKGIQLLARFAIEAGSVANIFKRLWPVALVTATVALFKLIAAFEQFNLRLSDMLRFNDEWRKSIDVLSKDQLTKHVENQASAMERLKARMGEAQKTADDLRKSIAMMDPGRYASEWQDYQSQIAEAQATANGLGKELTELGNAHDYATDRLENWREEADATVPTIDTLSESARDLAKEFSEMVDDVNVATARQLVMNNAMIDGQDAADRAAIRFDAFQSVVGLMGDTVDTSSDKFKAMVQELTAAKLELLEAEEAAEKFQQGTDALNNALDEFDNQFAGSVSEWVDLIEGATQDMNSAFHNMWRQILNDGKVSFQGIGDALRNILANVLHSQTTKPLTDWVKGLFSGGVSSSGSGGGFLGGASNLFGILKTGVTGLFSGGGLSGFTGLASAIPWGTIALGIGGVLLPKLIDMFGSDPGFRVSSPGPGEDSRGNTAVSMNRFDGGLRVFFRKVDANTDDLEAWLDSLTAIQDSIGQSLGQGAIDRIKASMPDEDDIGFAFTEDAGAMVANVARLYTEQLGLIFDEIDSEAAQLFRARSSQMLSSSMTEEDVDRISQLALGLDYLVSSMQNGEGVFGSFQGTLEETLVFVENLAHADEGLVQTLQRLEAQTLAVSGGLDMIGVAFGLTGEAAVTASQVMIDASGGLNQFASNVQFYFDNFLTEEERLRHTLQSAAAQVQAFNGAMGLTGSAAIDTRDELRDFINAQDLSTEAGQRAVAAALALAPALDGAINAFERLQELLPDGTDFLTNSLSDMVQPMADQIGADLVTQTNATVSAVERQTDAMVSAIGNVAAAVSETTRAIVNGLDDVVGAVGNIEVNVEASELGA